MMRRALVALSAASLLAATLPADADDRSAAEEASVHLQLARGYIASGDHTLAIAEQTKAIALAPTAEAFKARGEVWAMKRQCELAVADLNRAIELQPRDPDSYFRRAECLRVTGQNDGAAEDLSQVLRFNRSSAAALKLRAHVRLAQGRVSDALTDLRWAAGYDPRDMTVVQMLGFARFANGDFEIAAENLARSLRFRDDVKVMLLLYIARAKNGADGLAELNKNIGYVRTRSWPFPIAALFLGHGSVESVMEAARDDAARCEATFYIGHWLQVQGRRGEGYAMLKKAANICPKTLVEYETLSADMRRPRF